jgi:hypothetical protein
MSRSIRVALASLGIAFPALAFAQEASTTRIETRNFYGATVTLESGVRVFRALPPHSKVIINPGGRTPLSLGFDESRNYYYASQGASFAPSAAPDDAGAGQSPVGFYGAPHKDRRHGRHDHDIRGRGYQPPADRTGGPGHARRPPSTQN